MEDKQFNLQLTIQKLEEELSLYRNGTTGAELMELIHEKDNELKEVKSQLQESSKELNVLKNNFNTLIKSSKKALNANEMMKTEQEKLSVALQDMTEKYNHTSATLLVTQEALGKTEKSLEKVTEELEIVTKRAEEDEEKLRKLQEQSIGQVKKLNSQYSQIKDYEKDLKILEVSSARTCDSFNLFVRSFFFFFNVVSSFLLCSVNCRKRRWTFGKIKKKLLNYNLSYVTKLRLICKTRPPRRRQSQPLMVNS